MATKKGKKGSNKKLSNKKLGSIRNLSPRDVASGHTG
jgi:hypothetical protein